MSTRDWLILVIGMNLGAIVAIVVIVGAAVYGFWKGMNES